MAFSPYTVHTLFFLDDSPLGSYDFTLEQDDDQFIVPIPAPEAGVVTLVGVQGTTDARLGLRGRGYGHYVVLKGSSFTYFFAHLADASPIAINSSVNQYDSLGLQGSTGRSSAPHIHLELWDKPLAEGGNQITDRSVTRPVVEAYIAKLRSGHP